MNTKFDIVSENQDFPLIYWNPKFHKNPVKFRPIAGSRDKVLCSLEKVIGKVMKRLTSHFTGYCNVSERQTGKKHYFVIKNSSQMNNVFSVLRGKALSFDSYDFSNLYTNFEHEEILERLSWLIDLLFNNAKKMYINVSKNLLKVDYSDEILPVERGWSFSKEKLKEAIEFLIKNTYVEFGSLVFRQICGIPMGSIPAPDFANLALAVDEFRFVKKMLKDKMYSILTKMNFLCRYLDDIGAPNFPEFHSYISIIYPPTLTLSRSNQDSTENVAYLDLSVSVVDNYFVVKVYCKTDDYEFSVITLPFLDSNVAVEMCYYVYFGQILRFLRICSRLENFKERCIFLTRLLQNRGYVNSRLASKFNEVLHRHRRDWSKFQNMVKVRELMVTVVYGE